MQRVKSKFINWFSQIKTMTFNQRFIPNHQDYQKFIVVGRSRSGSNFLRGLLNDHDQILVFGELFQNLKAFNWAMPGYTETEKDLKLIQTEPIQFLSTRVFSKHPKSVKAVGLKIFYYHAQDGPWEPVWPYLETMPDLKVVHIKRRNILRTHLSRMRALLTDQWVNTTGADMKERAIPLKYDECLEDFTQTRNWETEFEKRFVKHEMLEIFYEDLAADYEPEIHRLQRFLEVDPRPVKPQTYKQAQLPLSQAIENFAELRDRFQGSPWEGFFEEKR